MFRVLCLCVLVSASAAAQDKPPTTDPVAKSAVILEEAIKAAPDASERVRLKRALLAMKSKSKPVKVIEFAKGAKMEEGTLRYSFVKATKATGGILAVQIQIQNTSPDDAVPSEAWRARLTKSQVSDDSGRSYQISDSVSGDKGQILPGESVVLTVQFLGPLPDKVTEFYLELPHHHDKPDTILLVKKDDLVAVK